MIDDIIKLDKRVSTLFGFKENKKYEARLVRRLTEMTDEQLEMVHRKYVDWIEALKWAKKNPTQCLGTTNSGTRCTNNAQLGDYTCARHDYEYNFPQEWTHCRALRPDSTICKLVVTDGRLFCGQHREGDVDIISGTGSRELKVAQPTVKEAVVKYMLAEMDKLLAVAPEFKIMSGMAEGFDELLAKVALARSIPVIAAVPSPDYGPYYWGRNSLTGQNRLAEFNALLGACEEVVYVCDWHMRGKANFKRNEYMVDRGHSFYVWDPASSGTRHCFNLIKMARKPFVVVSDLGF